jgi:hypothetical protein
MIRGDQSGRRRNQQQALERLRRVRYTTATVVVLLLLASTGRAAGAGTGDFDEVPLDVASGVFGRRLPFDVPFVVTGRAPFGTTRVEVRVEEKGASQSSPSSPLVSGVDADGRFRVLVEPVRPGRHFVYRLTFERRLPATALPTFRSAVEAVLRRDLALSGGDAPGAAGATATASALVTAYEQALNQGQVVTTPRGDARIESRWPLLDSAGTDDARAQELLRLADAVSRAQAERRGAVERYTQTAPSLLRELERLAAASSLLRLVEALEARPESDPRNPRSSVFLPPASRRLVSASEAELAALAEGRTPDGPALGLRDAATPEEADAFRDRYRRTAEDLQGLREWLQGLVLEGTEMGRLAGSLRDSGALAPGNVDELTALARYDGGAIRRAEQWARTLQVYAHEVQTALTATDRALARSADEVVAQAGTAVLRETLVTDSVSSEGGVYVSLDLGALYPPELERATLTVGANVYFAPVNKRAPLRANGIRQRLALTFGLTVTNMQKDDETRWENLLGEKANLFFGLGYRLTRSLRLGGGLVLFQKNDQNPLVDEQSLAVTPYVSLSFDVDLVGAFKGW